MSSANTYSQNPRFISKYYTRYFLPIRPQVEHDIGIHLQISSPSSIKSLHDNVDTQNDSTNSAPYADADVDSNANTPITTNKQLDKTIEMSTKLDEVVDNHNNQCAVHPHMPKISVCVLPDGTLSVGGQTPIRRAVTVSMPPEFGQQDGGKADEVTTPKWKQNLKMILAHIGLVILTGLYTLAGATMFYWIERPNEERLRINGIVRIHETREQLIQRLWQLSLQDPQALSQTEWIQEADKQLDNVSRALYDWYIHTSAPTVPDLHDSVFANTTNATHVLNIGKLNWSFPAAIFFAASTVATIGYGNLTPVTQEGRMFCVLFALLGVPLMLVTIADLGRFIGDGIVAIYRRYVRCKRHLARQLFPDNDDLVTPTDDMGINELADFGQDRVPVVWVLAIIIGYTALGGAILPVWEMHWSFWEASYFSFITMSTIGFGDFVPSRENYYWITLPYILLGLAIATMCVDLVGSQYIEKFHNIGRKFKDIQSRMKTFGDLLTIQRALRLRYGLTDDELAALPLSGVNSLLYPPRPYKPNDFERIYYIDQRTDTSMFSVGRSSLAYIRDDYILDDVPITAEQL